jgi:hypothetical protein
MFCAKFIPPNVAVVTTQIDNTRILDNTNWQAEQKFPLINS